MTVALPIIAALLLDRWLGEPRRYHPLVGFGRLAGIADRCLRRAGAPPRAQILLGALAWLLLVVPVSGLAFWAGRSLPVAGQLVLATAVLYFSVALRAMQEHARDVALPLIGEDLATARCRVGKIVSRDTGELDGGGVARAAVESVLENGNDAVIAPVFWFLVAGIPGVVAHRLANTLDACWGYRNERYLYFGRVAARADDLLNWLPARLCAALYCLCGDRRQGRACWRDQGAGTASPNAGIVMAAGAGSLGIRLGGAATYRGVQQWRPELGGGRDCRVDGQVNDIHRACALLARAAWLLAGLIAAVALIREVLR